MENNYAKKVKQWREYNELETSLKSELANLTEHQLKDAFYEDIAFGTGGLRGIIGVGTNRMNIYIVRKTTLGFYQYVKDNYPGYQKKGIVIAYDCRKFSQEFAHAAAEVFASRGVRVYIFTSLRPTPELSYAIRFLQAVGGIMITASHNPPNYNGYKVYDHNGCQLVPALADQVINNVNLISDPFAIDVRGFEDLVQKGLIKLIDHEVDDAYIKRVKEVPKHFNIALKNKKNIKMVFTPLHGTASAHMVKILEDEGFDVVPVKEQMVPDANFSTVISPNPEDASSFALSIKLGHEVNADILIATDPDADRMGIAIKKDNEYHLLTGNQTGAIILNFLAHFKQRNKKPVVFNTIVTSNLAFAIAKKHGLRLVQTLTGFKFIGEQAEKLKGTDEEFFFGFEESYGYVVEDFVRDKDAIQSTLALAYIASYYQAKGKSLLDVLEDIYLEYGYYSEYVHNIALFGIEGKEKIDKIMKYFQNNKYQMMAGRKITIIEDYDKLERLENNQITKINMPESLVLKYIFDDGGWFVLRPSGTEPKLKVYIAIVGKTKEDANLFIQKLKTEILTIIDGI